MIPPSRAIAITWKRSGLSLILVCLGYVAYDGLYKHHLGRIELAMDLSAPFIAFGIIAVIAGVFTKFE
jgi:hypothetical protein